MRVAIGLSLTRNDLEQASALSIAYWTLGGRSATRTVSQSRKEHGHAAVYDRIITRP